MAILKNYSRKTSTSKILYLENFLIYDMMDMATSMQSGKVREIFDWDLTICVYSDWHEVFLSVVLNG